jgi:hypothetical protein
MKQHEASRTLVKSPPELWAECSDAASLARHLGQFGEIRITRLEPETAVAWEGERASGTVRLEPSGWGTRVILTARPAPDESEEPEPPWAAEEPEPPVAAEEPHQPVPPAPRPAPVEPDHPMMPPTIAGAAPQEPRRAARSGFLARLRSLLSGTPARAPEPREPAAFAPVAPVAPEPEPEPAAFAPVVPVAPEPEPAPVAFAPEPPAPAPTAPVASAPDPDSLDEVPDPATDSHGAPAGADTNAALTAALDSLGQAHHRPFSRA